MFYKDTLEEGHPFSVLNLEPTRAGSRSLRQVQQAKLYNPVRKVSRQKKSDMIDLLGEGY